MKPAALVILTVTACAAADPGPPQRFIPVVWSETANVQTRAADLGRCELSIVGADASMPQSAIIASSQAISEGARLDALAACLRGRGYTIAEGRVCTAQDLATGRLQRKSLTQQLPPLSSVKCHDLNTDGYITS